jgi:GDP-L-fucose synthase
MNHRESHNRSPRVAILGGGGFVGRNLRNLLEETGSTVAVFSRTTGCDLLDLPAASSSLDAFRPEIIINCAALVGSVNFVTDFAADVVDVNMRIILNVYKIAQQMRGAVVVNPIANCAYPGVIQLYEERSLWDGPLHPSVLSYGSTRRMMMVLSKCYADQYGVRSVNLIVPNLYGPYDSVNPNKTHALNALAIKFVQAEKRKSRQVEVWGSGKPVREWLFVKDLADVVRRVITAEKGEAEAVNIAQNRGYNVIELVEMLRRLTGFRGEILYNPRYQDGAPHKVMDDRYFRQRFPDYQFTNLQVGLEETLAYYRNIL